jgi:nicotinamide mononucleotide transporter pnuC
MNPYELFIKPYEEYTFFQIFLEAVAAFFGLLSVFFSVKRNIWVYPTGIISTTIYVYILFNFGLLGDMLINVYYSIMSIYGWISWNKNTENQIISVDFAKKKDWLVGLNLFVMSFVAVCGVYYFKPFIDNHFSMNGVSLGFQQLDWANWLDIFTTSLFLIGMWFMAKRKVENWLFWIVGDLICIPMMLYKGLGITSLQYLVFTIMAVIGYLEWLKKVKK